jgi:pimeloyl-ACP methyl ester carboxylesterase
MMATSDKDFLAMQKMSIPRLLADTTEQEMVVGWSMKSDRKTFAQMYCDFSNTDLRERIAKITCPSLVLLEAPFTNMKEAIEAQFSKLKTADLRYANKGLHFVMYDDKEWYLQQIKSFL